MKTSHISIISAVIGSAVTVTLLSIFAFTDSGESALQRMFAPVISIDIPDEVEFAGQKQNIKRYDLRERFDKELNLIVYMHSRSQEMIKMANRYFPLLEPLLEKNGIPEDFKYLALIESSLNPRAVSPVGAAGLWQLMPETAKELGLEVNEEVDERYHTEKATEAACKYLQKAHLKFGDWYIAAASYNAGKGKLNGELNKQQAGSYFDMLLPVETSRYVFRMLAAKEFMNNPRKYGYRLRAQDLYAPITYIQLPVDTAITDLSKFAQSQGISYALLKEFNPWLRDRKLSNVSKKRYYINVPVKEELFPEYSKMKVHETCWVE